jgi:hypothetical protein
MGTINEPDALTRQSFSPKSINEPPVLPDMPPPVIMAMTPDTAVIGGEDFTLVLSGDNFFAGSKINFAGNDEPTTFDADAGTLSTIVKPSLWAEAVVVPVVVYNGETAASDPFEFTFAAEAAAASETAHAADPDDLEDEIEQEIEEGDIKPLHPPRRKKKR